MITSTSNAQVKELVRLMKKSKARQEAGVFLVEGPRMAGEVPPERIVKLYVSEGFERKHRTEGGFLYSGKDGLEARTEVLSDPVFAHVSDTKTPQGVLAVVKRHEYTMEEILGTAPKQENAQARVPHVMVLDNLQDPGNLGTIFRTAEAAGVTGILLSRDCVDIYNPKVIRSTMGAALRVPFLYVEDLVSAVGMLKNSGIRVYAAHLEGKNFYDQENYSGGSAFLIGNEGNGLREEVADCADCRIKIPMEGKAESLNAAVAAAVLMFEVSRQRRG